MTTAFAPGKVILFGEHAVVYGRPAIAAPVGEVQARARIEAGAAGQGVVVIARDLDRRIVVRDAADDDPLALIVQLTLATAGQTREPDLTITVTSTIPIARGMGSGAAVSTAIVRALGKHLGRWLPSQAISDLVYQAEVLYHGTPSGIDNTVIAFEKPVYFVKDSVCEIFWVGQPLLVAIADTGISSPTKAVVGDLYHRYQTEPNHYTPIFDRVGEITIAARAAIEQGQADVLGRLMDENHSLLQAMDVSSPELDRLVAAARDGGAMGAKLCGAGRGGNMIALVSHETRSRVELMLRLAGAVQVIVTELR